MLHMNHTETVAVTEVVLDDLLTAMTTQAQKYNITRKEVFYHELFGMAHALNIMGIYNRIEVSEDLETITAIVLQCSMYTVQTTAI